ncbi:ATP-binding protein [Yersinia ruckeri]
MSDSIAFQTRARTIDHLGREQIADCPTAISELWKNAYDAYARNVALHIFDGETPVAALVDDGHGMSRLDFEEKWLIVGTESKALRDKTEEDDRDGLPIRSRQGQKGIGRLSSAALGKLLLLVSKKKNNIFFATLIDWRLFENPLLMLNDIKLPITEFNHKHELIEQIPHLFDTLMGNIWGDGKDKERDSRLSKAWSSYSLQEVEYQEEKKKIDPDHEYEPTTQEKIEATILSSTFEERHFSSWSVWNGKSSKGTAMFMVGLHDDLVFQLSKTSLDDAHGPENQAKLGFLQTLSSFTDPFAKNNEELVIDFSNSVIAWNGMIPRPIIDSVRSFDIKNLEELEHILDGYVSENGVFSGRIKAFGQWYEDVEIKPVGLYKTRSDSRFGPFYIRCGSYEYEPNKSTLSPDLLNFFKNMSERYGGFMVYRDGLRVMPYGREDNDYFEIEKRRTKNAGRYFWSNRRTFGRVAITRNENPNLRDKAGREGLIDNKALKIFRELVQNILVTAAYRFFGSNSDIRKESLQDIYTDKIREKAENDKKKVLSQQRRRIRSSIKENTPKLLEHIDKLNNLYSMIESRISINSIDEAKKLKEDIDELMECTKQFSLTPVPTYLGSLEDEYRSYRKQELMARTLENTINFSVNKALTDLIEKSDYEIASEIYRSKFSKINASISNYYKQGAQLLSEQLEEFNRLVKECREQYKVTMFDTLEDLRIERVTLDVVLKRLDDEHVRIDIENKQKLSPYIKALSQISEQIDIEGLAIHSMNESIKSRQEVDRLHALAQLGITVEIIGHEIEGLDMDMTRGLKTIANGSLDSVQKTAYNDILHAQQALSDKWRFLSPLKLSGERIVKNITGSDIYEYLNIYFKNILANKKISLLATKSFLNFSVFEQPARIYPVFVNMVNNSQYWVQRSEGNESEIILEYNSNGVTIADTGPGVDIDDLEYLFTLFFTRKERGGRGIGLYLCKQNLKAGGHSIRYETIEDKKILSGANFVINFKGVKNV